MVSTDHTADRPSLGQLFATAGKDLSALVRSEIELAKAEVRADIRHAISGSALFVLAALCGLLALLPASIAAAYGVRAVGLSLGWSFLVVAGSYVVLAGIFALVGLNALQRVGPARRTRRTTSANVSLLRNRSSR